MLISYFGGKKSQKSDENKKGAEILIMNYKSDEIKDDFWQ